MTEVTQKLAIWYRRGLRQFLLKMPADVGVRMHPEPAVHRRFMLPRAISGCRLWEVGQYGGGDEADNGGTS
jgi:hypothetical protein